jgi:hypothetical protein
MLGVKGEFDWRLRRVIGANTRVNGHLSLVQYVGEQVALTAFGRSATRWPSARPFDGAQGLRRAWGRCGGWFERTAPMLTAFPRANLGGSGDSIASPNR